MTNPIGQRDSELRPRRSRARTATMAVVIAGAAAVVSPGVSAAQDGAATTTTAAAVATTVMVVASGPPTSVPPAVAYPDPLDDHANEVVLARLLGSRFAGTWQINEGDPRRVRVKGIEPDDLARVKAALGHDDTYLVESAFSIAELRQVRDELLEFLQALPQENGTGFGIGINVIDNQISLSQIGRPFSGEVQARIQEIDAAYPGMIDLSVEINCLNSDRCESDPAPNPPDGQRPPGNAAPAMPLPARPTFTG